MHGINESLEFKPVRIAVLVVSDTRTLDTDTSGATLVQRLEAAGHILADRSGPDHNKVILPRAHMPR